MKTAVQKLSFDNGGDFIVETRREVELYLALPADASRRPHLQLYAKTFVAFAIWARVVGRRSIFVRPGVWARRRCSGRPRRSGRS